MMDTLTKAAEAAFNVRWDHDESGSFDDVAVLTAKAAARVILDSPEVMELVEAVISVLNSDMAMREQDEGRKSKTLDDLRAAFQSIQHLRSMVEVTDKQKLRDVVGE